jgi:hypothetical protein
VETARLNIKVVVVAHSCCAWPPKTPARHQFQHLGVPVKCQTFAVARRYPRYSNHRQESAVPVARNRDPQRKSAEIEGKRRDYCGGSFLRNVGEAMSR